MGMLAAFLFGYWMGTRSGEDGMRKLRAAAVTLLSSDEFKTTVEGVAGMARGALEQGLAAAMGGADERAPRAA